MRKKVSLILVLALVLSMLAPVSAFAVANDYDGHWANEEITEFMDLGFVNGYGEGIFKPNNQLTRAELAKIINSIYCYEDVADIAFDDVDANSWFYKEIQKAVKAGYMKGMSDKKFGPNEEITREQIAVVMARLFNLDTTNTDEKEFSDVDKVSGWAKGAVCAMRKAGFMNGYEDNSFGPLKSITRAELVTTLYRALSTLDKIVDKNETSLEGQVFFNLTITKEAAKNINLKDVTVLGRLTIEDGAEEVVLDNCNVNTLVTENEEAKTTLIVKGESTVKDLTVGEDTEGVTVEAEKDSTIENVTVNAPAEFKGEGTIESAEVNSNDVSFENEPEDLTVEEGIEEPEIKPEDINGGTGGGSSSDDDEDEPKDPEEDDPVEVATVSAITVDGAKLVKVGTAKEYTAKVLDQNDKEMTDEKVEFSVTTSSGILCEITISSSVMTLSVSEKSKVGTVTVTAISASNPTIKGVLAVEISDEESIPKSLEIDGPNKIDIKDMTDTKTQKYTVSATDQYGDNMDNVNGIVWSVSEAKGVTISEDGVLSITTEADRGSVEITAKYGESLGSTYEVRLVKESKYVDRIRSSSLRTGDNNILGIELRVKNSPTIEQVKGIPFEIRFNETVTNSGKLGDLILAMQDNRVVLPEIPLNFTKEYDSDKDKIEIDFDGVIKGFGNTSSGNWTHVYGDWDWSSDYKYYVNGKFIVSIIKDDYSKDLSYTVYRTNIYDNTGKLEIIKDKTKLEITDKTKDVFNFTYNLPDGSIENNFDYAYIFVLKDAEEEIDSSYICNATPKDNLIDIAVDGSKVTVKAVNIPTEFKDRYELYVGRNRSYSYAPFGFYAGKYLTINGKNTLMGLHDYTNYAEINESITIEGLKHGDELYCNIDVNSPEDFEYWYWANLCEKNLQPDDIKATEDVSIVNVKIGETTLTLTKDTKVEYTLTEKDKEGQKLTYELPEGATCTVKLNAFTVRDEKAFSTKELKTGDVLTFIVENGANRAIYQIVIK